MKGKVNWYRRGKTIIITGILSILLISGFEGASALVIDHNCTGLAEVPQSYIDAARTNFRIWYGHTSHGSQITTGIENLQSHYGYPYTFNESGSGGALSYQEVYGDLGHNGDLAWEQMTRDQMNSPGNDRNVVMWSWCGGVSDNTEEGINIYLNAMAELENDYPGVQFIYMTGHLDGSGEGGNLHIRNNQIRDFCVAHNKILFDFADIESYDPDGEYFLDRGADDNCNYDGGNWAQEWCAEHPDSDLCWDCDCAHSQPLNCNLKGRAFWWMMARMAGWTSGPTSTPTPTPVHTPAPSPTYHDCYETGVQLWMPCVQYHQNDWCLLDAIVCNSEGYALDNYPLFIILEVYGSYFFGPSFTESLDDYRSIYPVIPVGESTYRIIGEFYWPGGAGTGEATFYGAITDPGVNDMVGNLGSWGFTWGE